VPNKYADPNEIELNRCGLQPDTPERREELKKGFAMNDDYDGPETR
jgi:hypothetical protein